MTRILQTALTLIWGAWFGGSIILFVAVQSLFKTFAADHATAGAAASDIFRAFNSIRLVLAAAAVVLTFCWYMIERSRLKMTVFAFVALATAAAVYVTAIITPTIEKLRAAGMTQLPEFKRLHGVSMTAYLAETLFILAAGIALAQIRIPENLTRLQR